MQYYITENVSMQALLSTVCTVFRRVTIFLQFTLPQTAASCLPTAIKLLMKTAKSKSS